MTHQHDHPPTQDSRQSVIDTLWRRITELEMIVARHERALARIDVAAHIPMCRRGMQMTSTPTLASE